MMKIDIPGKEEIYATGISDPVKFYYHPIFKYPFLRRLELLCGLFQRKGSSVLDVGYGSGISFLELNKRFDRLFGIDIHDRLDAVKGMLTEYNIKAELTTADILNLPYASNSFDCVLSMSALEHIPDLPKAIKEIHRVLKDNGEAILGFPSDNLIMKLLHYVVDPTPYGDLHVSNGKKIIQEISNLFKIEKIQTYPFLCPPRLSLYIGCRCIKKIAFGDNFSRQAI